MQAIVTLCNKSYIKLFPKWLNAVNKYSNLPMYLLVSNDVDISQEQIVSWGKLNCHIIQMNKKGNYFPEDSSEHACAEKLRLFKHLPAYITKILFIDVDILILDNFWDKDNYFERSDIDIMLCQDLFVGYKEKMEEEFKPFDPDFKMKFFPDQTYFYFNTGVFFASRQSHANMFEDILLTWQNYVKQTGKYPSVFDQNVFNYFLIKHDIPVGKIPIQNNCIRQYDPWIYNSQMFLEGEKVAGFHFNGGDADIKLSRWNILEKYLESKNDVPIKTTSIIPLIPSNLYFKLQPIYPDKTLIKSIDFDKFIEITKQIENYSSNNIVIGISGVVAAGKTMFAKKVIGALSNIYSKQVIYLPFDLWIDPTNLDSPMYEKKFFIGELELALNCIKNNETWMCPRYDLLKNGIDTSIFTMIDEELLYHGKRLKKIINCPNKYLLNDKDCLYLDIESNRIFSSFSPSDKAIYIIDGTLVFFNKTVAEKCYDFCIHVTSSWVNRISRMVRRYNRDDVYGGTALSELEYVRFLVQEAKECADHAVLAQFVDLENIIKINSSVETISNLLDIYYLRYLVTQDYQLCQEYSLDLIAIDSAIQEAYTELKQSAKHETLQTEYQCFLNNYHLLNLPPESKSALRYKLSAVFQESNKNTLNILYGYSKSKENSSTFSALEQKSNDLVNTAIPSYLL